jgi:hypothetical protein
VKVTAKPKIGKGFARTKEPAAYPFIFPARAFTGRVMDFRRGKLPGALALLFLLPAAAPAWDEGGHEIIATICEGRLNPQALAAVTQLAGQVPTDRAPYNAVTMACWMDDLRVNDPAMPDHGLFLSWHYIDLGLNAGDPMPSLEPGDDNELHGNVVQALKRAMVVLQGGTDPYVKSRAIACAMVMHLVGDIHQPLHAATKYFVSYHQLEQDRGGNREGVDNGPADEPRFNLHAFWDSAWRASMDGEGRVALDPRFRPETEHHPERLAAIAGELAAQPPPPDANLDPHIEAWAWESNQIARSFVYPDLTQTESLKCCRLSSGYIVKANGIARERLVLAAYRLAVLLNGTLGSDHPAPPPASYPSGPASGGDSSW